jgi:predicted RNase H-like nuclease (RuvC/YqgF family)
MQALSDKDDQIAGLTAYLAEANENASGVEEKIKEAIAEKEAEVKELSEKLATAEKLMAKLAQLFLKRKEKWAQSFSGQTSPLILR